MSQIEINSKNIQDKYGFTMMDNVVLMSPVLHNHSKVLYVHLKNFYFKISQAREFGVYKSFYISRETLGKLMQMSASSIDGYMKPLKEVGLIDIKSQGIGKPNVYVINDLTEEIVDRLQPDINKWKSEKLGSPNTVNTEQKSGENGSPNTVNDHILQETPQYTVKDPAVYGEQINTNTLNINTKNIYKQKPSNIDNQKSLFNLKSEETKISPKQVLKSLKGKHLIARKIQFVLEGELSHSVLTDLDLCFYFATKHKEFVGYDIPYQKHQYMETWRNKYNLSIKEAFELLPEIAKAFRQLCEYEKRKKSQWCLKIGWFIFDAPSDISRIMDKVKPKVNTKYVEKEQPKEQPNTNIYDLADEEF